LLPPCKD